MWLLLQHIFLTIQKQPVSLTCEVSDIHLITFSHNYHLNTMLDCFPAYVESLPEVLLFQLSEFLPVLKLYDQLYPERDMLPIPDVTNPRCVQQMAAACLWMILLNKKPQASDVARLPRPLPNALKSQIE